MLRARYFLKAKSNPMEYGPTSGRTWLITVLSVSVSSVRAAGFLFANDTLNRLSQESDGFTIGTKSISFTSQNTGDEFRRAAAKYDNLELSNGNSLAEMVRSDEGSIVRVEFSSGERPLLFVLSAYNERRDGLKVRRGLEPTVMLQVIEPARTPKSSTRSSLALEKGFGLTPAELRLVEEMCSGKTLDECAASIGSAKNTLRAHLRSIFAKTDTHRQAELIRLANSFDMWLTA